MVTREKTNKDTDSLVEKSKDLEIENNILIDKLSNQKKYILKLEDINKKQIETIGYYRDTLNKIQSSRSWKYTQFIRNFRFHHKKNKAKKNDNNRSILFLVHSWVNVSDKNITNVGGTTLHVLDIINNIKNNTNCYVLTVIAGRYSLVTFENDTQNIYDLRYQVSINNFDQYDFSFMSLLFELIENLSIDLVHIHHFFGFPCDLQFLPNRIKTIVTIHDYFPICPNIQLINYENKLCIDGKKLNCLSCTKNKQIDLETRNNAVKNLLENAFAVLAPDESVFKQLDYYLRIKTKKVISHGLDSLDLFELKKEKKHDFSKKNIAFVGEISKHKGLDLVKKLVENNDTEDIIYHLFGYTTDGSLKSNRKNYIFHGLYQKSELPKLLIENKIDLVIFPAVWPETFSYTLSETIIAGVPCLSYNLGAIANRIKKDHLGWVIDKDKDFQYQDFINMYDKIFKTSTYEKILENIEKFKHKSVKQMVEETDKLYYMDSYKTKRYNLINGYLEKYLLKYII